MTSPPQRLVRRPGAGQDTNVSDRRCIIFSAPGLVGTGSLPATGPNRIDCTPVVTALSLISPGTELAQLNNRTGSRQPVVYPFRPRAYCVGAVNRADEQTGGGPRVLFRGHHASTHLVDAGNAPCVRVPDGLSDSAALLCTQAMPGAFAIARAGLSDGCSLAVIGLGVIGHLLTRLLVLMRPQRICGIDRHAGRRASLDDIDIIATDASVTRLGRSAFDCVFIVCPDPDAVGHALRAVVPGGKVVQVAAPADIPSIDIANLLFRKNVSLIGAHEVGIDSGFSAYQGKTQLLQLLFSRVASKELDLSRLSTLTFAQEDAVDAYQALTLGKDLLHTAFLSWSHEMK
jgi:threonine dehydrogenase-like Zn-dependent dehydrogenase